MNWFQTILTSNIGCKLIDPGGHLPGGQDYKISRGHTSHWFNQLGSCSLWVATLKYYQRRFLTRSVFTTDTRLLLSLQELYTSETTFFLRLIISTLQRYTGHERNNSRNHLLYLLVWLSNQLMSFTLIRIKQPRVTQDQLRTDHSLHEGTSNIHIFSFQSILKFER